MLLVVIRSLESSVAQLRRKIYRPIFEVGYWFKEPFKSCEIDYFEQEVFNKNFDIRISFRLHRGNKIL